MEQIKIEKSEKINIGIEKNFEQKFIKNILSKLHGLDQNSINELEEFIGATFDEKQESVILSDQHKKDILGLESLVSKKEKTYKNKI